jgi:cytochrome c-type biogenesis protein CcmH/NrfG
MLNVMVTINVVLPVGLILAVWLSDRLRASWQAHVVALGASLILFALLGVASYRADEGQSIMVGHLVRMILIGFLYLPFLAFLVVTYVAVLVGLLGSSQSTHASYLRADHYAASGLHQKAVRGYRRELARDPENVDLRLKLAENFCELGDCEEAVQALRVAISLLGDDPERQVQVVFRLAEVQADMLGQFKDAARELDFIRKRFPNSPHAQTAQKRIAQYMARSL